MQVCSLLIFKRVSSEQISLRAVNHRQTLTVSTSGFFAGLLHDTPAISGQIIDDTISDDTFCVVPAPHEQISAVIGRGVGDH